MVELESCPFCGCKYVTVKRIEYTCQEDSVWFVFCHGCGAHTGNTTQGPEQAVKMWNRRFNNKHEYLN